MSTVFRQGQPALADLYLRAALDQDRGPWLRFWGGRAGVYRSFGGRAGPEEKLWTCRVKLDQKAGQKIRAQKTSFLALFIDDNRHYAPKLQVPDAHALRTNQFCR